MGFIPFIIVLFPIFATKNVLVVINKENYII